MYKAIIGANPSPPSGFVVTLEGANLITTLIVSSVGLLAVFVKLVSSFTNISNDIKDLKLDLSEHSRAEGHDSMLVQVKLLHTALYTLDKKIDMHIQDYTNYKESCLLRSINLNEKINFTWENSDKAITECKQNVKEIQLFLQKQDNFRIRG